MAASRPTSARAMSPLRAERPEPRCPLGWAAAHPETPAVRTSASPALRPARSGARLLRSWLLVATALLVLAGCASTSNSASALDAAQYAWSGAIRWGDFGGARNLVDPAVRAA